MHVLDTYEGNAVDAQPDETITVGGTERRRSRFRTTTDAGTEVGVAVGRTLRAGDVLSGDGLVAVVELEPVEALAIDLSDAGGPMTAAVELGHAIGNRHWDLAVREGTVLVPLAESEERVRATVEPHLSEGATVDTESVSPSLFDDRGPGDHSGHTHGHAHGDGTHERGASDGGGGGA